MSTKKPEIADSWEEIDEERLAGAITILKNANSAEAGKVDTTKPTVSGIAARQPTLPQMLEEELRPKMVARPMQILKRPQSGAGSDSKGAADSKPKTQIKSLDQRRQEYAEARLRILGSAHDDEETESKKTTTTTTTPTTNGHRINNVNNNNSAGSAGGGGGGGGSSGPGANVAGDGLTGNGANNNSNNMFRYHSPYRSQGQQQQQQHQQQQQQPPIGTFPTALQNGGPPRTAGMYFSSVPNQHQQHHPHHPMHNGHPMQHHPHHTYPHMAQHHHHHPQQQQGQQQQQQQQQQYSNNPYQQHFVAPHLNPPTAPVSHMYPGGGRNNGPTGTNGYYPVGKGYTDGGVPLLGHAPHMGTMPPYNGTAGGGGPYGQQANSHGSSPAASSIVNNQHVVRLPAGPDGSQGFNMRR